MLISNENGTISITSRNENETQEFGALLGGVLKKGCVVAINGTLGAGKTYLTKGISKGLGVSSSRVVTSPTFALINEYNGKLPIYHFDAYRLNSVKEMYDLDCDGIFSGDGVSIVEWADKVAECLPADILRIEIEYAGGTQRRINISSSGKVNDLILEQLKMLF